LAISQTLSIPPASIVPLIPTQITEANIKTDLKKLENENIVKHFRQKRVLKCVKDEKKKDSILEKHP
jgi:hypothetical protein